MGEPTRPVRNTRTWMKTPSYGKTKQHLFVGLLLGVIVLSTQAQALSIEQPGPPICCSAYDAQCESCKQGLSEKEYCRRNPYVTGCEKYQNGGGGKPFPCCRANNAKCLSCAAGLSEKDYCKKNPSTGGCKKKRNRDVPGCEKYHRRGSWGKNDRDDSRQQGTGASEIGLADDLGSMSTVPFGCLLLSLPIRAALGVPFWRGFLGIHFKSMYVDFLSSRKKK